MAGGASEKNKLISQRDFLCTQRPYSKIIKTKIDYKELINFINYRDKMIINFDELS